MENGGARKEVAFEKENGVGGGGEVKKIWCFKANNNIAAASGITIRGTLAMLMESRETTNNRETIPLGHGDPSAFPCFRTPATAEDAVVESLRSAKFNSYSPSVGILPARRAIAEHLSNDLAYKLSAEDVFLTVGCIQSIEIILSVLARPGANILLPRPGFPMYESRATYSNIEIRHFDLLLERNWEVDLDAAKALADDNTVAMVVINPGNPCGSVFSYNHMKKIAETARKLGILIIADEVYAHLTFGSRPFIPMGSFGSIAPVITMGSISKRWLVPGWRLGWITMNDPNGFLKEAKIADGLIGYLNISTDPATFIQDLSTKKMIGQGSIHEGLYFLQPSLKALSVIKPPTIDLWHWRLGHPSFRSLENLIKQFPFTSGSKKHFCDICPQAKFTRLPFPSSSITTNKAFQLIHVDIWRPFSHPSSNGCRYFLTIVDDYTRCTWVYLMHVKSQTQGLLKSFFAMVNTQFQSKVSSLSHGIGGIIFSQIQKVQSDNGSEFLSKEMQVFFPAMESFTKGAVLGLLNKMALWNVNTATFLKLPVHFVFKPIYH